MVAKSKAAKKSDFHLSMACEVCSVEVH